jgi:presenilin-like A22 family membrane protease
MPITASILIKRVLFAGVVLLVSVYVVDSISVYFRARHATSTNPYETLTAPRVFAIAEKGNKTEYQIDADDPTQTVTCVHALFPHGGYSPCWQVKGTLHQPIPM